MGSFSFAFPSVRRNVTTRFEPGASRNARYGSEARIALNASSERTMATKARPRRSFIAASALRSSAGADDAPALKTMLPLERTVVTSAKPAASKHRFSSGIFAFMGLTPLRNAAYRRMPLLAPSAPTGPGGQSGPFGRGRSVVVDELRLSRTYSKDVEPSHQSPGEEEVHAGVGHVREPALLGERLREEHGGARAQV